MSNTEHNTPTQLPTSMIALADEERAAVHEIVERITNLQQAIGANRERHLNVMAELEAATMREEKRAAREEKHLAKVLASARDQYKFLVDTLARKHIRPGKKFDFRPELGAFVEARRNGSET